MREVSDIELKAEWPRRGELGFYYLSGPSRTPLPSLKASARRAARSSINERQGFMSPVLFSSFFLNRGRGFPPDPSERV